MYNKSYLKFNCIHFLYAKIHVKVGIFTVITQIKKVIFLIDFNCLKL